jgi:aspartyl-tRNA synthetase
MVAGMVGIIRLPSVIGTRWTLDRQPAEFTQIDLEMCPFTTLKEIQYIGKNPSLKVLCHNVERCGITERVSEIKYGTAIY